MEETNRKVDLVNFSHLINKIAKVVGLTEEEETSILSENLKAFDDLLTRPFSSPHAYFESIAYGAFKEAYWPLNSNKFVLKFISWENQTSEEINILNAAEEEGVDMFFVPSFYMQIRSTNIFPSYLENQDSQYFDYYSEKRHTWTCRPNSEYEELSLTNICLQPTCKVRALDFTCTAEQKEHQFFKTPLYMVAFEEHYRKEYEEDEREKFASFEDYGAFANAIDDYDWWKLAVELYGIDACRNLCDFIENYHIRDLHRNNYGFMELSNTIYPVIMDWLSC